MVSVCISEKLYLPQASILQQAGVSPTVTGHSVQATGPKELPGISLLSAAGQEQVDVVELLVQNAAGVNIGQMTFYTCKRRLMSAFIQQHAFHATVINKFDQGAGDDVADGIRSCAREHGWELGTQ